MALWRNLISQFSGKPPATEAPSRPALKAKSAERLRNEQTILDTRRQILAKIETLQQERAARETVTEAIDRDTVLAAQVVRQMLLDLENKGKS